MSRIGKLPIKLPDGVDLAVENGNVEVKGPKGDLKFKLCESINIVMDDRTVKVQSTDSELSNLHGLTRSLIANMVKGVTTGWSKSLELSGTGFRATTNGNELQLSLGFSHPVNIAAPKGISFEVKENKITILGADKMIVGETAAKIRALRPADPYKLKGFKYEGEIIIKKAGKAAKAGA